MLPLSLCTPTPQHSTHYLCHSAHNTTTQYTLPLSLCTQHHNTVHTIPLPPCTQHHNTVHTTSVTLHTNTTTQYTLPLSLCTPTPQHSTHYLCHSAHNSLCKQHHNNNLCHSAHNVTALLNNICHSIKHQSP